MSKKSPSLLFLSLLRSGVLRQDHSRENVNKANFLSLEKHAHVDVRTTTQKQGKKKLFGEKEVVRAASVQQQDGASKGETESRLQGTGEQPTQTYCL